MSTCPACGFPHGKGKYCGKCGTALKTATAAAATNPNTLAPAPQILSETATDVLQDSPAPGVANDGAAEIEKLSNAVKKKPGSWQAYLNLAQAQLKHGHPDRALSSFNAATAIAPDRIEVLRLGAAVLDNLGKPREALEVYSRILMVDDRDVDATVRSARLLHESGLREQSLERLQRLRDKASDHPDILLRLAEIQLSLSDPKGAQSDLTAYKRIAGNSIDSYLLMGQAMMAQSFYDGAVKNYQEAMEKFSEKIELRIALAKVFLAQRESGKALLELERAFHSSPDHVEILLELGKLYGDMSMDEKTEEMFERIRSQHVRDGSIFLEMARFYMKKSQIVQAFAHLERAKECSPHHPEIVSTLGEALEAQGSFKSALGEYISFVELKPNSEWAIKAVIRCAEKTMDNEVALGARKRLIQCGHTSPDAYCDLGETLVRLHRFDEAEKAFEEAARLDPSCVRAYQSPELINIEKARAEGEMLAAKAAEAVQKRFFLTAIENLNRALELVPRENNWIRQLADLCIRTGELAKVSDLLTKVRAADPSNPEVTYRLARIYEWEGKPQLSTELLTMLLHEHPERMEAWIIFLRLKRGEISASRFDIGLVENLAKSISGQLTSMRRNNPVPTLIEGYVYLIYGVNTRFQDLALQKAEKLFNEVRAVFGENIWASRGLSLIHRVRGDVVKAAEHLQELIKLSSDPEALYSMARLNENFQHYSDARKCLTSLTSLFPENGWYRRKLIDIMALQTEPGGKNELLNHLTVLQQQLREQQDSVLILHDIARIQTIAAKNSQPKGDWEKKALLTWHKAAAKEDAPPWITWGLMEAQAAFLKGSERLRALNTQLKNCEKIARESPDTFYSHYFLAECHLQFQDIVSTEKAMNALETAFFMAPYSTETAIRLGQVCREMGRSVRVDEIRNNMIVLEPELIVKI